jgi:hypothetical protein
MNTANITGRVTMCTSRDVAIRWRLTTAASARCMPQVVRQREAGVVASEVRVANIRAALRLRHGAAAVGFMPGEFSGPQQVDLVQVRWGGKGGRG